MLTFKIICIGKIKEDYLKSAIYEYSKRLSKYCKLEILELPDEKIPDKLNPAIENEIKSKECSNIIKHIKNDSYIISLDLNGLQYSSEEFSYMINNISMSLNQEILSKCQKSICFSKMTFPHQLIRVFLLEQIFRGFKILNGETYHR